jgi:hypothetical protein
MRADLEFADDCHGDIAVIAGLRLLPFKVGHKLLLQRLRSPFAVGGTVDAGQLFTAAHICSRSYDQAARELYQAPLLTRLRARAWVWKMGWRATRDRSFVPTHAQALLDYIRAAEANPKNVFIKESAPRTHVPLIPLLIEELAAYNYTPEQVLELPMRKATFLRFQLLVKPDSGVNWRESWMDRIPQREESAHAE